MGTQAPAAVTEYLQQKALLIEERLSRLVPDEALPYRTLFQAARYSLLSGGKRLRPILTLATVEAFKGSEEAALVPACALEMIHTYSMIHDDLPCMDNDDFRRGKPTLHKVYPEGHAVLAGDYLLTHAFEVLSTAPDLSAEQRIALVRILATHAGGNGMIAGQVLDIASTGKALNEEELRLIHLKKTAALMTAAVELGGIVAQASPREITSLRHFGQTVGLAFQIVDDILDVISGQQKHGKEMGSDAFNDKATYVTLWGVDRSWEAARSLLKEALKSLSSLSCDTQRLKEIAELLVNRQI